jgi:hypothetical protein
VHFGSNFITVLVHVKACQSIHEEQRLIKTLHLHISKNPEEV